MCAEISGGHLHYASLSLLASYHKQREGDRGSYAGGEKGIRAEGGY